MRTLQLIALAFVALPAWADSVSMYNYFYPCTDLGVVDCGAFPKHYYGDFGMSTGLHPIIGGSYDGALGAIGVTASNSSGEVIGYLALQSQSTDVNGAFGFNGEILCSAVCAEQTLPVDINNNGLYLFNEYQPLLDIILPLINGQWLGQDLNRLAMAEQVGADQMGTLPLPDYTGTYYGGITVEGINDLNQILANVDFVKDGQIINMEGVFSPFAVPEPSALLLLATVCIGLAGFRRARGYLT